MICVFDHLQISDIETNNRVYDNWYNAYCLQRNNQMFVIRPNINAKIVKWWYEWMMSMKIPEGFVNVCEVTDWDDVNVISICLVVSDVVNDIPQFFVVVGSDI